MNTMNIENEIGYLYCLSNEEYKDEIYKIGFTENDPHIRMSKLNSTGVPCAFVLEFAKKVKFYKQKEQKIHKILQQYRINPNKEFFKCSLEKIRELFDLIDGEWYNEIIDTEPQIEHELKEDIHMVAMSGNEKYKCIKCNKIYSCYKSLWNHNKKNHTKIDEIEEIIECKICGKKYKHKQSIYKHKSTCSGSNHILDVENCKTINLDKEQETEKMKQETEKTKIEVEIMKQKTLELQIKLQKRLG